MNIKTLTIKEYLERKDLDAITLLNEMKKNYEKNTNLNILVESWFDNAIKQAKDNPKLIPVAIKNNFLLKGKKTTAASNILKHFVAPYTSTVIDRLDYHDCVFVGSCNMDEFAFGSSGKTSCYGPTISNWKDINGNLMCPGGSSSGSAVALSSDLCLASTGSDTGGSVRLPAAYCGVVGLKPTYGVLSRYGIVDFSSSLDCPGLFTKTVEDSEFLFSKVVGFDENDYTSVNYEAQKSNKVVGVLVNEKDNEETKQNIKSCIKVLEENGYQIKEIKIDLLEYMVPCYYVLSTSEAASNLSRYSGIFYNSDYDNSKDCYLDYRSEFFGEEVQRRIVTGNFMMFCGNMEGFYNKARKIISKVWENLKPQIENCDFVISPVSHGTAPTMKEVNNFDPVKLYMEDIYTCFLNLIGLPGISIPVNLSKINSMPLAVQLFSKPFGENLMFEGGKILEKEFNFLNKIGGLNV